MTQNTQSPNTKFKMQSRISAAVANWFDRNKPALMAVGALLVLWTVFTNLFNPRGNLYLPSPQYVGQQYVENYELIIWSTGITSLQIVSGFIIGTSLGILAGIIISESFVARQVSLPVIVIFYSIPFAIIAPLFTLWFGSSTSTIILFISIFSFFIPFVNTLTGMTQTREEFHQLGQVSGATRWQMVKYIKLMEAMPNISTGIKLSAQGSVIGAVIAEFIIANRGLGYLVLGSLEQVRIGLLFASLILIMILGLTFFFFVSYILDLVVPGESTTGGMAH